MIAKVTKMFTGFILVYGLFLFAAPITATADSRPHKARNDRQYTAHDTRLAVYRHAPSHVQPHRKVHHGKRDHLRSHRRKHRRHRRRHRGGFYRHERHYDGFHFGFGVGFPFGHRFYAHGHHLHVHDHHCPVVIEKHVHHHAYAAPVWHVDYHETFHAAATMPRLHIVVVPGHGQVYVDGRYIGNAKAFRDGRTTVPVTPGRHVVKLRYGGRSYTKPVRVNYGSATLVRATLH